MVDWCPLICTSLKLFLSTTVSQVMIKVKLHRQFVPSSRVAVTTLTMWSVSYQNQSAERMEKSSRIWATEALECCKQCWLRHSRGSFEDQDASRNTYSELRIHVASEERTDSFRIWARGHPGYKMVTNLAIFWSCPEDLRLNSQLLD